MSESRELYSKCCVCDSIESCPVCRGIGFTKEGVTSKQVAWLKDGYERAKHQERYFDSHRAEMNKFVDWLRENPYPPE